MYVAYSDAFSLVYLHRMKYHRRLARTLLKCSAGAYKSDT